MSLTVTGRQVRAPFVALALLAIAALSTVDAVIPAIHRAHDRHEAQLAAHREAIRNAELAVARKAASQITLPVSFRRISPSTTSQADVKACGFDTGFPSTTCWLFDGAPTRAAPILSAALIAAHLTPQSSRCHRFPQPPNRKLQIPAHTDCWVDAYADHQEIELSATVNLVFPSPPFPRRAKVGINGTVVWLSVG